jgi:hypothetical protein
MNRNLVGSIYGRFSIRIAHFVPIINKHGHHILPSFGSFGKAVSEEKIFFLEIIQSETRIVYGGHIC